MSIAEDQEFEVRILRDKLTQAEDKLAAAQRALFESDLKVHVVMKRLLTANDVKGDKAMRENILEQMNDLSRNIIGFFKNVGIELHATDDNGRPLRDTHRGN